MHAHVDNFKKKLVHVVATFLGGQIAEQGNRMAVNEPAFFEAEEDMLEYQVGWETARSDQLLV